MDIAELKHLLESVGLDLQLPNADNIAAEILQGAPQGKITFDYLKQAMQYQRFFSIQSGRCYVMLSLAEAETLRAALHEHQHCALFPGETLSVSLTVMAPTSLGMTLDSSHGFWPAGSYQTGIVTHCSRFIDSETNYSYCEANLLLQALQVNR